MADRKIQHSPLAKRLKQARLAMGLSQREVGLLAGLDARLANIRINQYERQAHHPNYSFVRKLAHALRQPEAYFYAADDELAEFISLFSKLDSRGRAGLLKKVRAAVEE